MNWHTIRTVSARRGTVARGSCIVPPLFRGFNTLVDHKPWLKSVCPSAYRRTSPISIRNLDFGPTRAISPFYDSRTYFLNDSRIAASAAEARVFADRAIRARTRICTKINETLHSLKLKASRLTNPRYKSSKPGRIYKNQESTSDITSISSRV